MTDATSGDTISGAKVKYTIPNQTGEQEARTGHDGTLSLGNMKFQTVSVKVEKESFDEKTEDIPIEEESCGSVIDIALNPKSSDGRIVLTWYSNSPRDLDLHMTSTADCNISYQKLRCGENKLDRDNRVSTKHNFSN